jgi:hypothetical protein
VRITEEPLERKSIGSGRYSSLEDCKPWGNAAQGTGFSPFTPRKLMERTVLNTNGIKYISSRFRDMVGIHWLLVSN